MASHRTVFFREVTPRNIYSITQLSLARQLERCAWFNLVPSLAHLKGWNEQLNWALRTGRWDAVQRETLSVRVDAETIVKIPVSFANNQFRAADSDAYPHGHDSDMMAAIQMFLHDDGVFFDIGASWGTFSFAVALRQNFRGTIHAFEPMTLSAGDFRLIQQELPLRCELVLHQLAVSDRCGTANLALTANCGGNHIAEEGQSDVDLTVERSTLDQLQLPPPSVIKIDVEGHEGAALRGAHKTLQAAQPVVIFESWLTAPDQTMTAMEPFLELYALGYSFHCPTWLDAKGRSNRLPDLQTDRHRFALVPFRMDERPLLAEGLNVVAIPAGRRLDDWPTTDLTEDDSFPFLRDAPLFR